MADVHMLFRRILRRFLRVGPPLGIDETSRIDRRVVPADIDDLGHMNNGVYLSVLDDGRVDLVNRLGIGKKLDDAGIYTVVVNETITFRKSLLPLQKYTIETRIAGYDERAVYIEQRHMVKGEIYAQTMLRVRFLRKSGGTAKTAEVAELTGADTSKKPPAWVEQWVAATTLPPTALPAPSDW